MNNINYKKNLIIVILLLLIITILPNKIEASNYEITNYDINIKVNKNNKFNIDENIKAYFFEDKHGIYRKIPLKNNIVRLDGTSSHNRAKVSDIETNIQSSIYKEDNYQVIKIGNPYSYVSGSQNYEISYLYNLGRDTGKGYDELYFNIIGNEWDTQISNITFSIEMPKEFDTSKIGFSSGYKGSTNSGDVTYNVTNNTITGSLNRTLNAGEALTIRIELPDKYFKTSFFDFDILTMLSILLPILFVFISYILWKTYGKDEKVIETVEFYPPKGYNSAEIGFLYKGSATGTEVVSLLVYLANKGYIEITKTENKRLFGTDTGFTITKLKEYDGSNENEKIFLEGLFKASPNKKASIIKPYLGEENDINDFSSEEEKEKVTSKDLYNTFYITLNEIIKNLNSKANKEMIFDKTSLDKSVPVIIMVILTFVLITFKPVVENSGLFMLPFAVLFPAFGFIVPIFAIFSKSKASIFLIIWGLMFGGVPWSLFVLPALLTNITYLIAYLLGIISITIMLAISVHMPKRNKFGNEILGKIEGFKNFLETAEKPKLEQLVMEDPTYFYDILPFTYVLGVSDTWIKKFESIVYKAPDWYNSSSAFNVTTFATSINSTLNSASCAMSSSPSSSSSSSSSGGGSSGGGSGGGGGGSW